MTPEQTLWQGVVYQAVYDANMVFNVTDKDNLRTVERIKREADAWIRSGGKDYRRACDLAGIDPQFIRDKHIAGQVDW